MDWFLIILGSAIFLCIVGGFFEIRDIRRDLARRPPYDYEWDDLMDPNENVKRQRQVADQIIAAMEDGNITNSMICTLADDLAELVVALDDWLTNGGFLPSEWTR
jgi:hypothetical protein